MAKEKRKIRSAGFSLFGATKFIRGKGKKERGQKEGEKNGKAGDARKGGWVNGLLGK